MGAYIFDTHSHYDDEKFEGKTDELMRQMSDNGVGRIITCATNLENAEKVISLAEKYENVFAAVGIYPHDTENTPDNTIERLRELAKHKKVVAIGEIGLDYYYEGTPKKIQLYWCEQQLKLANELKLPVTFHNRDAHADSLELLEKYKPQGVVHCFSGSAQMAKQIVKLGMFIGIGGVITFKNARVAVEVVNELPLEKIVLETDAPYLSPVPKRGETNRSDYIIYVAERIAQIKNTSVEAVLKITSETAQTVFKTEVAH